MKKTFKAMLLVLVAAVFLMVFALGTLTANTAMDDPADSYVKITAPNEDPSVSMWFEHSFKKVLTEDKTPSGMDTYSVYMAKNEIENAQFVLYSDTTKSNMSAVVSNFTDADGNTIPAEIYYQMYVTVDDVNLGNLYGQTSADQEIIREGEVPDPVYPLAKMGGRFQLNGGKSQAFYIHIKTAEDTPSGWYSATLDIKNSSGQIVKTATVFCYVWDFVIEEETALQTSFILTDNTTYGGTYEKFYNYLLENRLCATDVPGKLTEDNPYLTNPRVNSIRVAGYVEGGAKPGTQYSDHAAEFHHYTEIYNRLSQSSIWEEVEDKLYFYITDEPLPIEVVGNLRHTVNDAINHRAAVDRYWGDSDPRIVIPHGENHPYPYYTFTNETVPLSSISPSLLSDAEEKMLEDNLCTIWCPRIYGFTPLSEIKSFDYRGLETSIIRTNSGPYSGNNSRWAYDYYLWEDIYGEFADRVKSDIAIDTDEVELWAYSAGINKGYTYTNHIIENTGLQTKMMFWQLYQEDCTGYLYYASNNWTEQDPNNGNYVDRTVTGSNTMCEWKTNKWRLDPVASTGKHIYGNGILFYGATQAKMRGVTDYVGTIRVEMMRDGVEEYQMLTMIEELLGEKKAKDIVATVSTNVVSYLSLPTFSTSAWDSSMDEYDIMAKVRVDMGNTLEAATAAGACDHRYDDGKITKEATCLEIGYTTYTCLDCGAQYDEYIPAFHSEGSCFKVTSPSTATCTEDGRITMECTVCGFVKERTVTAFHNDADSMRYEAAEGNVHYVYCSVCNEKLDSVAHSFFYYNVEATCENDGSYENSCKMCGYERSKEIIPATGHTYVDGYCTSCKEKEPGSAEEEILKGDLDFDGRINAKDSNILKRIISGTVSADEKQRMAADVNGDGQVNAKDSNVIVRIAAGT